jgi:hypothetical protein
LKLLPVVLRQWGIIATQRLTSGFFSRASPTSAPLATLVFLGRALLLRI